MVAAFAAIAMTLGTAALGGCPGTLDDKDKYVTSGVTTGAGGEVGCEEAPGLIATRCSATPGCHGVGSAYVELAPDGFETGLIGRAGSAAACGEEVYINADAPEMSLIYTKLLTDFPCGSARMPLGTPLSDDETACVLAWVRSVAASDGS